ncbi:MAG: sigma-70 family RNA polymerase sigma factor [Rikenellaceae bacterium]
MNNSTIHPRQDALIAQVYEQKREAIISYIYRRIGKQCDAEDIAQDVFIQLLGYTTLLNEATLTNLIYTIARNQTIDYLRRNIRNRVASDYLYFRNIYSSSVTEETVAFNDLAHHENKQIFAMSPQKSKIYQLSVHDGLSAREIATLCDISHRTVEHHIYNSRREMRQALCAFVG